MKEYHNQTRRWYDRDPVLSKSLKVLEVSDDATQIQMALNLIKIIIEHNIEDNTFSSIEDIVSAVDDGQEERGNTRWYDIDKTLRTAIQMLERCPFEMQSKIAKEMASMVLDKVTKDEDEE